MNNKALKTLCKIAEMGSFLLASQALNMTLSAVSMQIKQLESDLGVLLFDRQVRPPQLTPIGKQAAKKAHLVLLQEEQLIHLCRPINELQGAYSIGMVMSAGSKIIPNILDQLRKQNNTVHISFKSGNSYQLEKYVLNSQLDAAIINHSGEQEPALNYSLIMEEPLVLLTPKSSHPFQSLEDAINQLPFVHYSPHTGVGKMIDKYLRNTTIEYPTDKIVLDDVEPIVKSVERGLGVTILPLSDALRYTSEDHIYLQKIPQAELTRKLMLITRLGSPANRQNKLLVELALS